jgi:hypothetical protein
MVDTAYGQPAICDGCPTEPAATERLSGLAVRLARGDELSLDDFDCLVTLADSFGHQLVVDLEESPIADAVHSPWIADPDWATPQLVEAHGRPDRSAST